MIAVVAPEPAAWLAQVLEAAHAAGGTVMVFAPWAARTAAPAWLPARVRSFWTRRQFALSPHATVPGWFVAEAATRAWARGRTDRHMATRFALRAAADTLAARWLPPAVRVVVAPALAARATLAAARRRNHVATVLVEDIPSLRALHADLERAARVHPDCAFLRRYRAPARTVARQETERVLADRVLVRGAYARSQLVASGVPAAHVLALSDAPLAAPARTAASESRAHRVLLAGLATARGGVMEALAALAPRPHVTLLVRTGEGTEPADLLARPRVRAATRDELTQLAGVDAVVAPAWCESYPREVALAAAAGVPVVATARAAGFVALASAGAEVTPGDAEALGRALDVVLAPAPGPPAREHPAATTDALRAVFMDALA